MVEESDGEGVVVSESPMAYAIGSGNHSRSYLFKADGFLMESPITWYAATQSWKISPGYDSRVHWGFSRPARLGCVQCHAGRVEAIDSTTHKLVFHEQKIGCESCHGPGSLHVESRRNGDVDDVANDYTIVHPAKLSRELNEAICARCHLRSAAFVNVRGRTDSDFRPGLPLTDYRIDYRTRNSDGSMTVTGHFEQMHQSRCYTESKTMTCTTCHNPHDSPSPKESVAHYRRKCLSCHEADGGCQLPDKPRLAQSPNNNCIQCHMPRSGTDIPHFAFTHHRIGTNHNLKAPPKVRNRLVALVPFGDLSRLPKLEQDRCLGLAELEYSEKVQDPAHTAYRRRALRRLIRVHSSGIRDATVLAALARLFWEEDNPDCLRFATAALQEASGQPTTKINANLVIGDWHLRHGRFREAADAFRALTTIRRWDDDWKMLGICLSRQNDHKGAVRAFEKAVAIRRDKPDLHQLLAEAHQQAGNSEKAQKHFDMARRLARLQQRTLRKSPRNGATGSRQPR